MYKDFETKTSIIITQYSPSFKYSVIIYIIGIMAMKLLQTLYFYNGIIYVPVCKWMQSN